MYSIQRPQIFNTMSMLFSFKTWEYYIVVIICSVLFNLILYLEVWETVGHEFLEYTQFICVYLKFIPEACKLLNILNSISILFTSDCRIRDTKQLYEKKLRISDLNTFDSSRDIIIQGNQQSDEVMKLYEKVSFSSY